MNRTGQKVFGVLAIVAGIGIIVAVAAGVEIPPIVLVLLPLAVIGYAIYYWVVIRPAPYGVEPPDRSPVHGPD